MYSAPVAPWVGADAMRDASAPARAANQPRCVRGGWRRRYLRPTQSRGELRDRRGLEQRRRIDFDPQQRADAREHLRPTQRVAAQLEEVVERADTRQVEQCREDGGDCGLLGVARWQEIRTQRLLEQVGKLVAQDLAQRIARQIVDEDDRARHLVRHQLPQRVFTQLLRVDGRARATDHGGHHVLAQQRVRQADGRGVVHPRMLQEHGVDLARRDFESAAVDEFLDASRQVKIAVGVEPAEIPGAKPALVERAAIGLGVVLVAAHDAGTADHDFAAGACRQGPVLLVHDHDFGAGRGAHGARASPPRQRRVLRDQARFGRSVALNDRHLQRGFQPFLHRGRHSIAARAHEAQRRRQCRPAALDLVDDGRVDGRAGGEVGRPVRGQPVEEAHDVESRRQHGAGARLERHDQAVAEAAGRVQRRDAQAAVAGADRVRLADHQQRALRDGHDLGDRGSARRVHDQRVVVGTGRPAGNRRARHLGAQRHEIGAGPRSETQHAQPGRTGRGDDRGLVALGGDQRIDTESRQQRRGRIRGETPIQRHAGGPCHRSQHRQAGVAPVGERGGDPVPAAEAVHRERRSGPVDSCAQLRVGDGVLTGRQNRGRRPPRGILRGQQAEDRWP
jgi:hypothetical protein